MAGLSCGKEVRNLMMNSDKRPDVAILGALRSIITDVRTVSKVAHVTPGLVVQCVESVALRFMV